MNEGIGNTREGSRLVVRRLILSFVRMCLSEMLKFDIFDFMLNLDGFFWIEMGLWRWVYVDELLEMYLFPSNIYTVLDLNGP